MTTNIDWTKVTSLVATEHGAMVNKEAVSGPPLPPGQTVEGGQYLGDLGASQRWVRVLYNVVNSFGKLLFATEAEFDGTTAGGQAEQHAKTLWSKYFYHPQDNAKSFVHYEVVANKPYGAWDAPSWSGQFFFDGVSTKISSTYTMQKPLQTNCPAGTIYDPNKKQCMGCGAGYEYNIPMGQCVPIKKMSTPGRSYSPYSNQPVKSFFALRGVEDRVDWSKVTSLVAVDDGVLVNKEAVTSLEGLGQSVIEYQFRFPGRVFIPRRATWTPFQAEPRVGLYIGGRYVGDVLQSAAEWLRNLEIAHLAHAPGSMPQISWTPAYSAPVPAPFYATPFYQVF